MAAPEYIDVPPAEAIEHFRRKKYHTAFDWRDTDAALHLRSFTVAKAMRVDILGDIREAVDAAMAEGMSFEGFRASLEPTLRKKGWWGRQMMTDPETDVERLVQLGSPHRLRTIYDTNIRMSTARGRWERFERNREFFPYLRYVSVLDGNERPEHRAWHDTVLPMDHPWWTTHAPPNGWHCRCLLVALSEDDLERYGLSVSPDPAVDSRPWTNRRSGKTVQVPRGIDPGFAHNVGTLDPVRGAQDVLSDKLAAAAPDIAAAARAMELDDYIASGRAIREELVDQAGAIGDDGFPAAFRSALHERLRAERGAGTVEAEIAAGAGGKKTAARVREAATDLPASWVRRANTEPLEAARATKRGSYDTYSRGPAKISVTADIGNPLHEYVHHVQHAVPELDELFQALHRRRTAGDPLVPVSHFGDPTELCRPDGYFKKYVGREYDGVPGEVLTMAMQAVFHPVWGVDYIRQIARDDPELLDLVIGTLFRFDPP